MRYVALPLSWVVAALAIVWAARWPNPYLEHVAHMRAPHSYPVEGVLWTLGLTCAELVLVTFILRPRTYVRSWIRALVAFGVAAAFLFLGALGSMHSPPFYTFYLWWLLLVAGSMLLLCIWSSFSAVATTQSPNQRLERP